MWATHASDCHVPIVRRGSRMAGSNAESAAHAIGQERNPTVWCHALVTAAPQPIVAAAIL